MAERFIGNYFAFIQVANLLVIDVFDLIGAFHGAGRKPSGVTQNRPLVVTKTGH
jgi:hypothetical protein